MNKIYFSYLQISIISLFVILLIFKFYNKLYFDQKKGCEEIILNDENLIENLSNENKYLLKIVSKIKENSKKNSNFNYISKISKELAMEYKLLKSHNQLISDLDKQYDYICFWDVSVSNDNLKKIIDLLSNKYLNCVLVKYTTNINYNDCLINYLDNETLGFPLLVNIINLEDVSNYLNKCRFIVIDSDYKEQDTKLNTINNPNLKIEDKVKLCLALTGLEYNLPVFANNLYYLNYLNNLNTDIQDKFNSKMFFYNNKIFVKILKI